MRIILMEIDSSRNDSKTNLMKLNKNETEKKNKNFRLRNSPKMSKIEGWKISRVGL